ncbi:MAG: hypothetical protein ABFR50_01200 [Candidatus Fermentibacteria bacterium]
MYILAALSVFFLLYVPLTYSELQEFQYDGPGLALITPFDSGIIAIPWGYGSVLYLERGSASRDIPWQWDESSHCSAPAAYGDSAAACLFHNGSDYIALFSPDSLLELYGPWETAGRAAFDGNGDLWFTADGFLHRNGVSTGIELESYTLSVNPSGTRLIFCDRADRICIMNTEDGVSSVLTSDYRFYSPEFVSSRGIAVIITPTLEGEIVRVSPDNGVCTSLAEGSMPFWWGEMETILYSVTSDDGYMITAGEIWSVSLDGMNRQITFSPGIHEICPVALGAAVYAIDAAAGSLITVQGR